MPRPIAIAPAFVTSRRLNRDVVSANAGNGRNDEHGSDASGSGRERDSSDDRNVGGSGDRTSGEARNGDVDGDGGDGDSGGGSSGNEDDGSGDGGDSADNGGGDNGVATQHD